MAGCSPIQQWGDVWECSAVKLVDRTIRLFYDILIIVVIHNLPHAYPQIVKFYFFKKKKNAYRFQKHCDF